jgi:cytochrome c-type biogenesis protein CcmH/NrfG
MSAVIDALKKSLETDPENWETRHALIEACNGEELFDDAVDALNGAESLPGDDAGLVWAGKCYSAVGATDQAHGIYAAALEVNPDNEEAKSALAEIEAAAEAVPEALGEGGEIPQAAARSGNRIGECRTRSTCACCRKIGQSRGHRFGVEG